MSRLYFIRRDQLKELGVVVSEFPHFFAVSDALRASRAVLQSRSSGRRCRPTDRCNAQDARTYAEWGFDLLKYDWCSYGSVADGKAPNPTGVPIRTHDSGDAYAIHPFMMGDHLRKQKRDIVFSLCQYGAHEVWKWGMAFACLFAFE